MLEILLISAGAVLETLFIMRSYKRRDASSVVLKTMASVVFVLLGCWSCGGWGRVCTDGMSWRD